MCLDYRKDYQWRPGYCGNFSEKWNVEFIKHFTTGFFRAGCRPSERKCTRAMCERDCKKLAKMKISGTRRGPLPITSCEFTVYKRGHPATSCYVTVGGIPRVADPKMALEIVQRRNEVDPNDIFRCLIIDGN